MLNRHAMVLAVLVFAATESTMAQTGSAPANAPSRPTNDPQLISIQSFVGQIEIALANVQSRLSVGQLPTLKSVTLTLQSVVAKSGAERAKLWIVSSGKTWEREKSHEINLVLIPPAGTKRGRQINPVAQQLEDVIVSAGEGTSSKKTPLRFSGLAVELGFVVNVQPGGGVEFEIVPVSTELAGDFSKTAVHKILVVFEEPSPAGQPASKY